MAVTKIKAIRSTLDKAVNISAIRKKQMDRF